MRTRRQPPANLARARARVGSALIAIRLYIAVFVLPAILLFSSVRTFREIDTQREVYLRQQAAAIAGRLETVDIAHQSLESAVLSVADEYPPLRDLKVLSKPDDSDPVLGPLWAGRELFRTGFVNSGPNRVYRAYVPFHSAGVMNLAQIDLDPAAADLLRCMPATTSISRWPAESR